MNDDIPRDQLKALYKKQQEEEASPRVITFRVKGKRSSPKNDGEIPSESALPEPAPGVCQSVLETDAGRADNKLAAIIQATRNDISEQAFSDEKITSAKEALQKIKDVFDSHPHNNNLEMANAFIVLKIYLGTATIGQVTAERSNKEGLEILVFSCSCLSKAEITIFDIYNKKDYPRLFSKKKPYRNRSKVDSLSVKRDSENIKKGLQVALAEFLFIYSKIIKESDTKDNVIDEVMEIMTLLRRKIEKLNRFISSIQVS